MKTTLPLLALMTIGLSQNAYSQTVEPGLDPDDAPEESRTIGNLSRRADERRPADQLRLDVFDKPLTIGGEYEGAPEFRGNFALDDSSDTDQVLVDQEMQLEALYEWSPNLALFAEVKLLHTFEDSDADDRERDLWLERGQTWLYWNVLPEHGIAVQVGRQNLREKRSWWWDADLDALRVYWDSGDWQAEFVLAEELAKVRFDESLPGEDEDIRRAFGRLSWEWSRKQRLELFWLLQDDASGDIAEGQIVSQLDEDGVDGDLRWVGARALGRWKVRPLGRVHYWLDTGWVTGDERVTDFDDAPNGQRVADETAATDVDGWAVDAGLTWQTNDPGELNFSVRYARGSGPGSDANDDKSYRQTLLNTNRAKVRGVERFRYYGELLRPELSNLTVVGAGVGRRFLRESSIDLVYNRFKQVDARPELRGARLQVGPSGVSDDIGEELDLIVALKESRHWEWVLSLAAFKAGEAFAAEDGEIAYRASAEVTYAF